MRESYEFVRVWSVLAESEASSVWLTQSVFTPSRLKAGTGNRLLPRFRKARHFRNALQQFALSGDGNPEQSREIEVAALQLSAEGPLWTSASTKRRIMSPTCLRSIDWPCPVKSSLPKMCEKVGRLETLK